jgi:predicted aconitase with swiveling domain
MTSIAASRVLVPGDADGDVLALTEPLSFWGGLDPATGTITDVHHPQHGEIVTGRILVMPSGRGSSSSSSVLAEAIRALTAPAAIVLSDADPIVALGAIVAEELYGTVVPIVEVAQPHAYATLASARRLRVRGSSISADS